MIKFILCFMLLFGQTAYANCPEDIQVITKGQVANCDGLLFSEEASAKVDDTQQELEHQRKVNELLSRKNVLLEQYSDTTEKRLQLYIDQSHTLAKEVNKRENQSKWEKLIYFGLGVFATGIAVYGAGQLN